MSEIEGRESNERKKGKNNKKGKEGGRLARRASARPDPSAPQAVQRNIAVEVANILLVLALDLLGASAMLFAFWA